VIGDKNYYGRDFEKALRGAGLTLLRPARKGEPEPAGRQYTRPLRQVIESVSDTLKGVIGEVPPPTKPPCRHPSSQR